MRWDEEDGQEEQSLSSTGEAPFEGLQRKARRGKRRGRCLTQWLSPKHPKMLAQGNTLGWGETLGWPPPRVGLPTRSDRF